MSPPKLDLKDSPLPPPLDNSFGKDDVPKKPTPDTSPKQRDAGKQPAKDPKVKANDPLPRKQRAAEGDGSGKQANYRLSRIGELSIDISPAPKPYNWKVSVGDQRSLDALLIGVFDGQVTLR